MIPKQIVFTLLIIGFANLLEINGQRSPYAGSRPSGGYKDRLRPDNVGTGDGTAQGADVANRLGESSTERLPYDAYGDVALVNHYNSLPIDKRPFWLINQVHVERQRGQAGGTSASNTLNQQPAQTAAQATANANTNNNGNVASRFGENNPALIRPAGRRPNQEQDNIYDHNAISQLPVVYPVNIAENERQQMEANVRQNLNQNGNTNQNQNQRSLQVPRQVPVGSFQASRPVPVVSQFVPEQRFAQFQPSPQFDFPAHSNGFGIAPYFVDYD